MPIVCSYKKGSRSAKDLANAMGIKRMKLSGSRVRRSDAIINWGSTTMLSNYPHLASSRIINHPQYVREVANKLNFYRQYQEYTPKFTTSFTEARDGVIGDYPILARHTLTSHSGQGIVVCHNEFELAENAHAKVFTQYIKKNREYRIHFVGDAIRIARKKRRNGMQDACKYVRSHQNGYVFCTDDIRDSEHVMEMARRFISETNLDFGAIDIIHSTKTGVTKILEVNTAMGLEGSTLEWYRDELRNLIGERR